MKQSKWPGSGWVELHWSGTQNKFTVNLQIGENTMWTWGSFQATRVGSVKILRSCLVCFCFAVFETESFCVQAGFEHAILPMLALNSWLLCLAFPSAGLIAVWAIRSHYVTGHSKQRESCYGKPPKRWPWGWYLILSLEDHRKESRSHSFWLVSDRIAVRTVESKGANRPLVRHVNRLS